MRKSTYARRLLAYYAIALLAFCTGCASQAQAPSDSGASASFAEAAASSDPAASLSDAATSDSLDRQDAASSSGGEAESISSSQAASQDQTEDPGLNKVVLGDERFDQYLAMLEGKRVALFSNHTGIVGDEVVPAVQSLTEAGADLVPFGFDSAGNEVEYGPHILDALVERGVNVVEVFCPEHGFRGTEDAGAAIDDTVDGATGVPIVSLYGGESYPTDEALAAFDVLVVDIQDVGLRYYTYYLTMYHLMDACATQGKEVVVLDRPNPNGFYVDGPILQADCASGVGELPIPVVHGLTLGELAQMINGEGWLAAGPDSCNLTVIPCENYAHAVKTPLVRRPSPNLKDMRAVYLYASTCFFENTAVSVGRGTAWPFTVYGSPYLAGAEGCDFSFVPQSVSGATEPAFLGWECYGVDLRDVPLAQVNDQGINLEYLVSAYHSITAAHPVVGFFGDPVADDHYWFDLLMGTTEVRHLIEQGRTASEIEQTWADDVESFRKQRAPYLLYEDA